MAWTDQVYLYCERGQSGTLWAEPMNAVSNGGFFLATLTAFLVWRGQPQRGLSELALIALVALIGVGSFLFHTFATRWAMLADVAPIAAFIAVYLVYALRRFLGLTPVFVTLGLALFAGAIAVSPKLFCPNVALHAVPDHRCLNGSTAYVAALLMLVIVGAAAAQRNRPASGYLLAASAVFALSLIARTFDLSACGASVMWGRPRGTHALWHVMNAVTLGLLLLAAIRHGGGRRE